MQKVMMLIAIMFGFVLAACQTATDVQKEQKIDVRKEVVNFEAAEANICQHARHEYGMRFIARNFPDVFNSRNLHLKADKLKEHCNARKNIAANDYAGMERWGEKLGPLSVTPANEAARRLYRHSRDYEARTRQYFICNERVHDSFSALLNVVLKYSLPKYHKNVKNEFNKWVTARNRACPITTKNLSQARKELIVREKFYNVGSNATRKSR